MNMNLKPLADQVGLNESVLKERKEYLGLTPEEEEELAQFRDAVAAMAPSVVDEFYTKLEQAPEFRALVNDADTIERMHAAMRAYLTTLFSGQYDMSYACDRLRLGKLHFRIGVSESLLIASLARLKEMIDERLLGTGLIARIPEAVSKVFLFDLQLIIDAYVQGYVRRVDQARWEARHNRSPAHAMVAESTPVRRALRRDDREAPPSSQA
ncbi:MAG: protoglobin domain-containing protein [Paracoccaceae bacterium]